MIKYIQDNIMLSPEGEKILTIPDPEKENYLDRVNSRITDVMAWGEGTVGEICRTYILFGTKAAILASALHLIQYLKNLSMR